MGRWEGVGEEQEEGLQRARKKLLEVMGILFILIVVTVYWVYIFIKTYQFE